MKKFTIAACLVMLTAYAGQAIADGDVTVTVNNGKLRVTGQDNTDQSIVISRFGPNFVRFESLDGLTTFNGLGELNLTGFNGELRIDMKSGEKLIAIHPGTEPTFQIPGRLRISTTGNDTAAILLANVEVVGNLDIKTKNGADAIGILGGEIFGNTKISTGNGNDVVGTDNGVVFDGNFVVQSGKDNDYVLIFDSLFLAQVNLKMGGGNDSASFVDATLLALNLNGNGGFDRAGSDGTTFLATPITKSIEAFVDPTLIGDDAEIETNVFTLIFILFSL